MFSESTPASLSARVLCGHHDAMKLRLGFDQIQIVREK